MSTTRTRFALSLSTLLVVTLALPAAPSFAADEPTVPRIPLPPSSVVAVAGQDGLEVRLPEARVEDLLRTAADPRDPRTYTDALRAHVKAQHGVELPDLRRDHSARLVADEHDPQESPEEVQRTGTYAFPSPAGDLDGDNLDDVIVYEVTLPEEHVVVRALRGLDGAELWQREYDAADAVGIPIHDITGDGIDDILLYTLEVSRAGGQGGAGSGTTYFEYSAEFEWRVGVQSGADGATAWEQYHPGQLRVRDERTRPEAVVATSYAASYTVEAVNIVVLPFLSGDHDGDGLDDLVLDEIDISVVANERGTDAWVAGTQKGDARVRGTTRASVVSGRTGRAGYTRLVGPGPSIAVLVPIGDVVGDGHADLLWDTLVVDDATYDCVGTWVAGVWVCTDEYDLDNVALELEVLDGATFQRAWRFHEDGLLDAFAFPLGEDLTGDKIADLMVFDARSQNSDSTAQFAAALVSGASGELVWRRDSGADFWEFPMLVDSLGGEEGLDLLFGQIIEVEPSTFERLLGKGRELHTQLSRVEGASGKTFLHTTHTVMRLDGDYSFRFVVIYLGTMSDATGDGIADAIGGALRADFDEDFEHVRSTSTGYVEGSASGRRLYGFERADLSMLHPTDDLDGDDVSDVFTQAYAVKSDRSAFSAVSLREGSVLWSGELHGGWLQSGGDQDGTPGVEVLRTEIVEPEEGRINSSIASLRGTTGELRWDRHY